MWCKHQAPDSWTDSWSSDGQRVLPSPDFQALSQKSPSQTRTLQLLSLSFSILDLQRFLIPGNESHLSAGRRIKQRWNASFLLSWSIFKCDIISNSLIGNEVAREHPSFPYKWCQLSFFPEIWFRRFWWDEYIAFLFTHFCCLKMLLFHLRCEEMC